MISLFFEESFYYLVAAGFLQAIIIILGVPVICLFSLRADEWGISRRLVGFVFFNVFLLLWGCLGHFGFHILTFEKLYYSADRFVDWFAFIPFGEGVIKRTFANSNGYLIGDATLSQLSWLWAAFAAPVWLLAFWSTRWVMRRWMPAVRPAPSSVPEESAA